MAAGRLNLTRDQLATFLTTHEQIKQFENLFRTVDTIAPQTDTSQLELLVVGPHPQANNSPQVNYLDFNISPHASRIRRMAWNDSDKTIDIGMDYGVVQQVGLETYARVENSTGATIPNGSVVGFAGAGPNGVISVTKYLADGSQPNLYILGVVTHDLPDTGQIGYCTTWGFVRDINTSAFNAGDVLYASPTVAGGFTNVKPTAPDNCIPLAAVMIKSATAGVIFVRPTIEQVKYYGEFSKTTNQSPAAINTEYLLTFDSTRISNGIVIGATTSQIIVPQSGLYNFDATLQIVSGSASAKSIWVWFKKNGTAVSNSARLVTSDINNGYVTVTLNESISLNANEYVEIAFASDSTSVTFQTVAATAFAPQAPAISLSVSQIQQ